MEDKDSPATVRAFLRAFGETWFTAMCGPLTVPFAFLALYVEQKYLKLLFGVLAVLCAGFTSYWIWKREREARAYLESELKPRVSIAYSDSYPGFIALKSIRNKSYRVLRVRVTNEGGENLHNLRAQLRLLSQHYSYEDADLTLKEVGLPIIEHHLVRRDTGVLPRPRTSFSLSRGEQQFVNAAMQENENGKWGHVTWCLSEIGADNYSNGVNVAKPVEFSVIVLGGIYPPCSKPFVLFLDKEGVLQMKEAD